MQTFEGRVRRGCADLFSAGKDLAEAASRLLLIRTGNAFTQTIRYFAAPITNSYNTVVLICIHGQGADAVKITRSMFELQITLNYLLSNPGELRDFLDFDAIARWKRLQFYKSRHPELDASFPDSKKSEVDHEFARVKKRFEDRRGNIRDSRCRHSIAGMAERAGLTDMYELFYRYASALHHVDPMGLGMLIDGDSLDVQPSPSMAHVGIALGMGISILLDALRSYGLDKVASEFLLWRAYDAANPGTVSDSAETSAITDAESSVSCSV